MYWQLWFVVNQLVIQCLDLSEENENNNSQYITWNRLSIMHTNTRTSWFVTGKGDLLFYLVSSKFNDNSLFHTYKHYYIYHFFSIMNLVFFFISPLTWSYHVMSNSISILRCIYAKLWPKLWLTSDGKFTQLMKI